MKTALFSPVLFIIIKKNMISFLFCISVFCIFPASLFAQGGQAGPLTWNINGSTLTISGEGEMPDYTHDNPAPWRDYVFNSTAIVIEYGVTSIGNWAFYTSHCGLGTTLISLPNSLTRIGDHAFHAMCTLKSITIPCSVTSIGLQAFSQSKLTSVTIPISVTYIGQGAFAWCYELTAIIIPNSITRIEHGICNGCNNLISITIPNSITSIGEMAFYGCNKLTTITLPSSIASIEMRIFENCTSLVSITNLNLIPINIYYSYNPVFAGVNQSACTLKVPTSAVSAYEDAEIWQNFNIVSGGILVYPKSNNSEYGYVTGNALYEANATATVTATAFTGYHFVNWTIDGEEVSTDNTYSFTVTEDVDLVANFEKILETFLVIVNSNNDEYGTATGSGLYEENKTVTVKATAYSGYKFVNWTIAGEEVSSENPYSFPVTEDVELVAHFKDEVGIYELGIRNYELGVYPNPTNGELRIMNYELGMGALSEVEVFDVYGRKLSSNHLISTSSNHLINITHLPAGLYFVKITTEFGNVVKKVVKY